MKAIVVGAGFGGIAAALRLRAKGYEVSLIDRCAGLGGRAQVFERNGFRHDAGPTVITAPFLFEELFGLFGEKFEDHVRLVPLTPWYRFHFSDNTQFDYGGTLDQTLAEIARIEPDDREGYRSLLVQSEKIFRVGFTQLSAVSFHRFSAMVRQIPALLRLRSHDTVWQLVCRHLKNPKLRQAFSIQPLLVGGNPFDTTSIYGLIHYLERAYGVHFAMGGTGAITAALGDLMSRHGIEVKLDTTVRRIHVDEGVATGVTLADGQTMAADVIVSNADPAHLYSAMIRPEDQAAPTRLKLAAAEFSMGLFVLYFGTTRQYPDVAHHTIWLGERYRELLADIFHDKLLSEDFSLYLHRPTATDPSFAPAGCDSFYVLCPVPNLKGTVDWGVEGPRLHQRIVAALEKTILPGLGDCITSEFTMTPENFRSDYLSAYGAGFSVAPLFRQSAWFRFHNRAEGIRNLYLVGAGTHPGAGLPGVLCSAKVMDSLVPAADVAAIRSSSRSQTPALRSADRVLAQKGKSFHWARHWMAASHAARATRLYGFCRYVDDIADEDCAGQDPRTALALVAKDVTRGASNNPIVADAIALMRECDIPPALVLTFIDGITSDLDTVRLQDESALLCYCYQAAGTVGSMMCRVLGCDDPVALRHAVDLGIAMQLTNICRDVAADATADRRYLPASLIGDIAPAELVDPASPMRPRLQAAIAHLLDTADRYYRSGEAGLAHLPLGARCSILVAGRVYRAIGTRLRERDCAYWLGRTVVPQRTKGLVTLGALSSTLVLPGFWVRARRHDAALHGSLSSFLGVEEPLENPRG
ncbi:phytoene desaturase family protein [Variovorax sp. PAMC 28711]|uniref:phytoene desaturase family protein n=1 Tax=Variovorax sp. PAMC 28711 TaxID=1795631 RepID=UPI0009E8D64D|nr:phytoene desaturase family protein [Variovorax sp. PAMC 28711]